MGTYGNGLLHITGSDHGTCAGVKPSYFRIDLNDQHAYLMYSYMLTAAKDNTDVSCLVSSGCGQSNVWVQYCRGEI